MNNMAFKQRDLLSDIFVYVQNVHVCVVNLIIVIFL
jgi:hypothetical protein